MLHFLKIGELIEGRKGLFLFIIACELVSGVIILFFPWKYTILFLFLFPTCIFLLLNPFYAYLLGILLFPFWTITITGQAQAQGVDFRWADIAFIIAAIGWIYKGLLHKNLDLKKSPLDFPIFLIFLWMVLSFFWSKDLGISTYELLKKLYAFFVFYLTLNLINSRRKFDLALKTWIISGLIASFFGLYEMYFQAFAKLAGQLQPGATGWTLRSTAFFLTPNKLGYFLNLCIMLGLGQYAITKSALWKKFLFILIIIMFIVLVSTFSRTSYMTFVAGAFVMFLSSKETRKVLTTCLLAGLIGLLLISPTLYIEKLLVRIQAFMQPSIARDYLIRADIIRVSWQMFRDHPLIGVGIGNFQIFAPVYQTLKLTVPHNIYLYFLAEFGAIGFSLFLFWSISLLSICVQGLKKIWGHKDRIIILSLLAGLTIFFLQAMIISFTFREIDLWSFVGLTVVAIEFLTSYTESGTRANTIH